MSTYYDERKELKYYKYLRTLLTIIGCGGADSIIDVGSNGVDLISFLPIKEKFSLDLQNPIAKEGIVPIYGDFLEYDFKDKVFDIVTCFQVLEHIYDEAVEKFARKLLGLGKIVVISVPYMWPKGHCKWHYQDPVDLEKLISWFGMEPMFIHNCDDGDFRCIAVFVQQEISQEVERLNGGSFMRHSDYRLENYYKDNCSNRLKIKGEHCGLLQKCSIDNDVEEIVRSFVNVNFNTYIFGAGVWGKRLLSYCKRKGLYISGFVLSDCFVNADEIDGIPIKKLSDIDATKDNIMIATSKPIAYEEVDSCGCKYLLIPDYFFRKLR